MSGHTPGPWRVGDAGFTIFGPPNGNPSPKVIGRLRGEMNTPFASDQVKADARLIAAAPEMLDALKALMSRFEKTGEAWMHDPAMVQARAAVAKAEGK